MRIRVIRIVSCKNNRSVADQCGVAESFLGRLRGLIGVKYLEEGKGLMLKPCNDIHMWFMSIPIDVVFVKTRGTDFSEVEVTSVYPGLQPWHFFPVSDKKASVTLELPVGTIDRCELQSGDLLCLS